MKQTLKSFLFCVTISGLKLYIYLNNSASNSSVTLQKTVCFKNKNNLTIYKAHNKSISLPQSMKFINPIMQMGSEVISMIHHISISAQNPQHVAQVLAEVLNGQAFPFPPNPGSYMVFAFDEYGTGIEVYPLKTELIPGKENQPCTFVEADISSGFTATHAAISVSSTPEKIEQIGKREGWRVLRCNRNSSFEVIEFWLENKIMLELLTPEMAAQYLAITQPKNLQKTSNEASLKSHSHTH